MALIARPSVTPTDAGCLDLLTEALGPLGFTCERVRRPGSPVDNMWARRGTARPLVCFAGHTDVVPPGELDKWVSPPFVPTVRDGHLYGRGAADMKGAVAAFVAGIAEFVSAHPAHPGSIALLLTSDEEGPAVDGTTFVVQTLQARGEDIDYCIVGEPTSEAVLGDTVKIGRRGSLSGTLTVLGVQGHVAYPHLARNALHGAGEVIADLAATKWDDGDDAFPPTSWQASNIRAGTGAGNVIPGVATVEFNFRFSPRSPVEELQARVKAAVERRGWDHELTWVLQGEPFVTREGVVVDAISQAIKAVTGVDAKRSTSGGTSDGRFIVRVCPQVVEFGVRNPTIHKVNECVSVADLELLPSVYAAALRSILLR